MEINLLKLIIFCSIFVGIFAQNVSITGVTPKKCFLRVGKNFFEANSANFTCADQLNVIDGGLNGTLDLSFSHHLDCWCFVLFRFHLKCGRTVSIEIARRCFKPHLTISAVIDTAEFQQTKHCHFFRTPDPDQPKNSSVDVGTNIYWLCAEYRDVFDRLKNEIFFEGLANQTCVNYSKEKYLSAQQEGMCGMDPVVDRFCFPTIQGCQIAGAKLKFLIALMDPTGIKTIFPTTSKAAAISGKKLTGIPLIGNWLTGIPLTTASAVYIFLLTLFVQIF